MVFEAPITPIKRYGITKQTSIGKSKKPLISSYNDSTKIKPGIWNSFKKINLDHYQSVGHMVSKKQRLVVDSLYINHAKILMSLPK